MGSILTPQKLLKAEAFFLREGNLDDSLISGQHKLAGEVCGPASPWFKLSSSVEL